MAESPQEYQRVTPQEFARNIIDQCREGNCCLILDLVKELDSGKVVLEQLGDPNEVIEQVQLWLAAQGSHYLKAANEGFYGRFRSDRAVYPFVGFINLRDLLEDTQELRNPELHLTLHMLGTNQSWFRQLQAAYPPSELTSQGTIDRLAFREGWRFIGEHPGLTVQRRARANHLRRVAVISELSFDLEARGGEITAFTF